MPVNKYLLASVLLPFTTLGQGASFDCKGQLSRVERQICASSKLSNLDDILSEAFAAGYDIPNVAQTQKVWLRTRNSCESNSCIESLYEQRIAELSCNPKSALGGSSIGTLQCAGFANSVKERELVVLEEKYNKKIAEATNNPDYTLQASKNEQAAWRAYRDAECALYGAIEGGSDGWKNAYMAMCMDQKTKKRIDYIERQLEAK